MGQVHIFLFIKSSADTMIQRYQHCSRLAVEALVALGYGNAEALRAVKNIENIEEKDTETILKEALKRLI